jgi:hypothetical protein
MTYAARPGCVLRSALVTFGVLFLPAAVWFAWHGYWGRSLTLLAVSAAFLWLGLSRREDSWISAIDALGDRPHD